MCYVSHGFVDRIAFSVLLRMFFFFFGFRRACKNSSGEEKKLQKKIEVHLCRRMIETSMIKNSNSTM